MFAKLTKDRQTLTTNDSRPKSINTIRTTSSTDLNENKPISTTMVSSEHKLSPIESFYANKSILVTGATGFIGKVLIEKLLFQCPEIKKIYLLIREAKGKTSHERLMEMISKRPFNIRLKLDFCLEKLVAVESDISMPRLGLDESTIGALAKDINIVFHVAASVKFEAPLETNMRHNVVAAKELLELACEFNDLQSFVHVSTAYSNCQLQQIDEKIYPITVPEDPRDFVVTKEMIDNRPNTYTYTKAIAESIASSYSDRINVVIVRPSIVMSSMNEPAEGWVDTINGPVGLSVLGALGILQKIKVNSEVVFDLIPVDIVSNALIAISWASTMKATELMADSYLSSLTNSEHLNEKVGGRISNNIRPSASSIVDSKSTLAANGNGKSHKRLKTDSSSVVTNRLPNGNEISCTDIRVGHTKTSNNVKRRSEALIFNLTTGSENPCSFYHYFSIGREEAHRKPSVHALRPLLKIPKQKGMNSMLYWIHKIFSHLLFAYIVDTLLGLFGQKRMVIKAVNKMHQANEMFDYFCSNQWEFRNDNVKKLRQLQSPEDRVKFNCDVREINWDKYAKIGWMGCRRYILKESDDTIEYAKRRYRYICIGYNLIKFALVAPILGLVIYHFYI